MMLDRPDLALAVLQAERARRAAFLAPPDFANDQQSRFYASRAPELLYSGAMGAGKSRILCEKAWSLAKLHPGATLGLFRKTANSLAATTHRTFERDVVDVSQIASRNRSEHYWALRNGSRIYFLGLDPDPITGVPSKIGSLDLAWAGVDEAVELSEGDWLMLLGRLRDPRIPWHQLAAATNPGPPTHWLKARFTPSTEAREYLHATALDNRFLPADYLTMIAGLPDTATGRRLGKGEWAGAEGVIWTVPDEQLKAAPGPHKRVVAGVDWGFVHAFACEVVGQSGSGRLGVVREVYAKGALVRDIIPALQQVARDYPGIAFYADPSEPAYIAECRAAGLHMETANNDVDAGIQSVAAAIHDGMTIDPACSGLLNELPGYTWAPARQGGFHEKPIEINDDACDALRYAVMAFAPDPNNPWARLAGKQASGVA